MDLELIRDNSLTKVLSSLEKLPRMVCTSSNWIDCITFYYTPLFKNLSKLVIEWLDLGLTTQNITKKWPNGFSLSIEGDLQDYTKDYIRGSNWNCNKGYTFLLTKDIVSRPYEFYMTLQPLEDVLVTLYWLPKHISITIIRREFTFTRLYIDVGTLKMFLTTTHVMNMKWEDLGFLYHFRGDMDKYRRKILYQGITKRLKNLEFPYILNGQEQDLEFFSYLLYGLIKDPDSRNILLGCKNIFFNKENNMLVFLNTHGLEVRSSYYNPNLNRYFMIETCWCFFYYDELFEDDCHTTLQMWIPNLDETHVKVPFLDF